MMNVSRNVRVVYDISKTFAAGNPNGSTHRAVLKTGSRKHTALEYQRRRLALAKGGRFLGEAPEQHARARALPSILTPPFGSPYTSNS